MIPARRACGVFMVLLASACSSKEPSSDGSARPVRPLPPAISVIVTGDVGGQLTPVRGAGGLARQVAALQGTTPPRIVMDAGDRFFRAYRVPAPHQAAALSASEVLADALKETGAVSMAVGERDLAMGLQRLRGLAQRAQVRLLSANLRHTESATLAFSAFLVVQHEGRRLGVVAASPVFDEGAAEAEAYALAGVYAEAPGPALKRAISEARLQGAEQVVGLLHMHPEVASQMIRRHQLELDAAVIAHARGVSRSLRVGGVPLVVLPDRNRAQAELRWAARGTFTAQTSTITPQSGSHAVTAARVSVASQVRPQTGRAYVGVKACAERCHKTALQHYKRTAHAKAWTLLVKLRQTRNLDCVACHATGYAQDGGVTSLSKLRRLRGVGCEACHGPNRAHLQEPEQARVGPVQRQVCWACHGQQRDTKPFVMAERWPQILGPGHGAPAAP